MNWRAHITANPAALGGKPLIKGTRISVEFVLDCFAGGWSYDNILEAYPHLTREQIQAAIAFATELFKEMRVNAIHKLEPGLTTPPTQGNDT